MGAREGRRGGRGEIMGEEKREIDKERVKVEGGEMKRNNGKLIMKKIGR